MENQVFFHRVSISTEKDQIFSSAVQAATEIVAKVSNSQIFNLIPYKYENNHLLCRFKNKPDLPDTGNVIIQLFIGGEKYYFHPKYEIKLDSMYLFTNCDLFHLQRREDFRLRLPPGFQAELEIHNLKGKAFRARWALMDISGGGCRAEIQPAGVIVHGDTLEGRLLLQGRDPFPVKGVARHVAPHPDKPTVNWAGIQFTDLSDLSKNSLVAIVLDLYRELFSKLK